VRTPRLLIPVAAVLLALAALPAGCEPAEKYPRWSQSRQERLRLLAEVEKVAVVPFRDDSGAEWPGDFGPEQFARLMADEVVRRARFKVIYPRELLAAVEGANREALERARSEKRTPAEDEVIDLQRSELDAVTAGRAAGADAVLVATINDFEVYPPKRLALTMRLYLCAAPTGSAAEIIAMSDAGVPLEVPAGLRDRFIWERQRHYDSLSKSAQFSMGWYARKHGSTTGFGEEIFYYSTEKFFGFVAHELGEGLYADAQLYNRPSRTLPAPAQVAGEPAETLDAPGSGFQPGHGESGVRR
jgi:hypothetical protein